MIIREGSAADKSSIEQLAQALHGEHYRPFRFIGQQSSAFVAEEMSQVVGGALVTFTDYGLSSYGMIEELIVAVEARQKGHGAASSTLAASGLWN